MLFSQTNENEKTRKRENEKKTINLRHPSEVLIAVGFVPFRR
jgi:hypothetical protein